MKLLSKEALVLGGVYGVIDAPFTYMQLELVTDVFFIVFIICALMLCFNRTPKFLLYTIQNYPRTCYYLSSVGWIPYFSFIVLLGIVGSYYCLEYANDLLKQQIVYLGIFNLFAAVISFGVAFIRASCKKSGLGKGNK